MNQHPYSLQRDLK
ncbi:hypothetical protein BAURA86_01415 [Brevibacterium aurantiacum]|uniref:Uncharacterized protein n=1 Tax=Brevibacterium aurantiacum TaxID=273384 RepID=A0A2H1J8T2_BREAU|nr:hypothetical protein BAURA86_01415 [Brevibacterium aurantiacum]